MKTFRIITVVLALLLNISAKAQTINVGDVSVKTNETATVNITLKNASAYVASGFTVVLPEGITFTGDASSGINTHWGKTNLLSDNTMKVAVYSRQNTPFSSTASDILTFQVKAGNNTGNYVGKITGPEFSSSSYSLKKISNVSFNINVVSSVGISEVTIDDEDAPIYNLNGQRVETPTKGVFIQNGKKIIKK